jgi:hypothetical protein
VDITATRATWNKLAALALLAAACAPAGYTRAGLFDTNLLINPNAEAGTNSPETGDIVFVPGWDTTGNFTVISYEAGHSNGFPGFDDPGPAERGTNYFAGGPGGTTSTASQTIDLLSLAALVDVGAVNCGLSGYFGGWVYQLDNARLTASFQDANSNTLGALTVGPVYPDDRTNDLGTSNSLTGLFYREDQINVPVGTRWIQAVLKMTHHAGPYNDGYADNLSLMLIEGPPRPRLSYASHEGCQLISWPTNAAEYRLEFNDTFDAPILWTAWPDPPDIIGEWCVVTNICTNAHQFFRLRKP